MERGPAWTAPIYYRADTRIASAHITPLLRGGETLDLDRIAAIAGHANRYNECRTAYAAVQVVPPMHKVVLSRRGVASSRVAAPTVDVEDAALDDLAAELRRLLLGAVKRAIGERRVALMLSGGLDSSCVLAAILETRGARATDVQLTLDFDARHSDRPFIRALEAHYGISVIRVSPSAAPTDDAFILDSIPSRHPTDPLDFAAARMARERGAELLVSGVGGDQLFGGYFAPATVMALRERNLRGAWRALRATLPHPVSWRTRIRKTSLWFVRPYVPPFLLDLRARRSVAALPDWVGPRLRDERVLSLREYAARPAARTSQESFDELCMSPHESEYDAELRAQNDFAFGIPRVDPLYDEELVRFLRGVRQHTLFADASYRGLLRRAMRGLLPEVVRTRTTKSQFEPGLAESIPLARYQSLLSFECLEKAGIVRPASFRRYLAPLLTHPASDESGPLWLACWSALTTEAFLRARA